MSDSTLTALTAISPVDGRYWNKLGFLTEYFSEFSLIKYRVFVEIEYFIALCQIPLPQLESIDKVSNFLPVDPFTKSLVECP